MNLKKCWDTYEEHSAKASALARSLAFAAIAITWVFRTESDEGLRIPAELFLAGLFAVSALALDFLHYVAGTVMWGSFARFKELWGTAADDEFKAPRIINWPANTFFTLKLLALALSYVCLLSYLVSMTTAP